MEEIKGESIKQQQTKEKVKIIDNSIPPLKYFIHQIKGSTELKGTTTEMKYIQILDHHHPLH